MVEITALKTTMRTAQILQLSFLMRTAQPFAVELPASSQDGFLGSP